MAEQRRSEASTGLASSGWALGAGDWSRSGGQRVQRHGRKHVSERGRGLATASAARLETRQDSIFRRRRFRKFFLVRERLRVPWWPDWSWSKECGNGRGAEDRRNGSGSPQRQQALTAENWLCAGGRTASV